MIQAAPLQAVAGIAHGFFIRTDLETEDRQDHRRHIAATLGLEADRLIVPRQCHGDAVLTLAEPPDGPVTADALIARRSHLGLAVQTADCAPILLAEPEARLVAAIHAGWKGALAGILDATLSALNAAGGRSHRLIAAIGPAISLKHYEVGDDFRRNILKNRRDAEPFLHLLPALHKTDEEPRPSWHFDLTAFIAHRLRRLGVENIHNPHLCTYADPQRFPSARYARHRKKPDRNRLYAAIRLI